MHSCTIQVHRCPASCARNAQNFSGKEIKKMKRNNGVRAASDTFSLMCTSGCMSLAVRPFSIHRMKTIYGFQFFFAEAIWLVSPKCANTL